MKIRRKGLGAVLALTAFLGATAADCKGTGPSEMSGTVVKHYFKGTEKDGIQFLIVVRTTHGDKPVRITAGQWTRCVKSTMYPACLTPHTVS